MQSTVPDDGIRRADLPRPVEVLHEGRWVAATLLGAYRCRGRWRAVVRFSVAPGEQYQQGRWEGEVRALPAHLMKRQA